MRRHWIVEFYKYQYLLFVHFVTVGSSVTGFSGDCGYSDRFSVRIL